jgi:hypothetical protein
MNTARIVVLTIALGTGGAAYSASGSDNKARAGAPDVITVENRTDDQALKRGESVSVARSGIPSSNTAQK